MCVTWWCMHATYSLRLRLIWWQACANRCLVVQCISMAGVQKCKRGAATTQEVYSTVHPMGNGLLVAGCILHATALPVLDVRSLPTYCPASHRLYATPGALGGVLAYVGLNYDKLETWVTEFGTNMKDEQLMDEDEVKPCR